MKMMYSFEKSPKFKFTNTPKTTTKPLTETEKILIAQAGNISIAKLARLALKIQ